MTKRDATIREAAHAVPAAATDVTSTSIVLTAPRVPYAAPDGRMPGM